jgi:hypothetical protein
MQDIVNALVLPAIAAILVYDVGQGSAAAAVNAPTIRFRRYFGRNSKFAT